jgi:hypothetical protein
VIRTAYQGVQFEMMQKEMRKPTPKTLKQAIQDGYKIFGSTYSKISHDMIEQLSSDFFDDNFYFQINGKKKVDRFVF